MIFGEFFSAHLISMTARYKHRADAAVLFECITRTVLVICGDRVTLDAGLAS